MNSLEKHNQVDACAGDQDAPNCGSLTRRTAVRGLIASFAAMAGGGIVATEAARQKSKNRKKRGGKGQTPPKGNPGGVCKPGSRIAFLSVPSNGNEIVTPVLEQGQRYTLRASGFWSTNGDFFNDAAAAFQAANPRNVSLFDNGVRLGLSVDGGSPEIWGAYVLSHEYTTSVVGQGRAVSLRMQDSVYTDNARLLNLEVICG